MGKFKKKSISDVKLSKPTFTKKQNPFEVHINREKFKVIGKKSNFDKGLPGVARAKAINKRKETLLQEYKIQHKSNKFIDRRIGERNKAMTNEDKIIARFTAERMKAHKRKALFNLAEEEILTHKGRSISEAERFDDPRSDDDDDTDGRTGILDANFVEDAHFGGGMFSKSKNNRESIIDQLIAESKKRKLERQQTREKTLELTEKLDTEWKDLIPLIGRTGKNNDDDDVPNKGRGDSYDIALRELKFEARGKPSDKLKSEEEIAEQEAKRLQKLEEERMRRMRGEDTEVTVTKKQHKSADALEDDFQLDEEEEYSLMYDEEGNMIPPKNEGVESDKEEAVIMKSNPDNVDVDTSDEEEEDSEDDNDDDSDNDGIGDLKDELSALNEAEKSNDEAENDEREEEKSEVRVQNENSKNVHWKKLMSSKSFDTVEKDADNVDSMTPAEFCTYGESKCANKRKNTEATIEMKTNELKTDEESDKCSSTAITSNKKKVCFNDEIDEVKFGENASNITQNKTVGEIRIDLMKRKELMDKARKELPFTYQAPKTYEELQELFNGRDLNEIAVIVERIIKCNHPKLREENKQNMVNLYAFLMQYLNDSDHENCWSALDRLVPYLYDLLVFSPEKIAECIIEILKEKQSDYSEKKYKYPTCSTLVFLKLVPLLFPASDKRHRVTTPSLVFLMQMLQNCRVNNRRSIATGLFIVSLVYEYVSLSKRICPQALNFLCGLLHLASPTEMKSSVVLPFKEQHRFLYLHNKFSKNLTDYKLNHSELSSKSSKIDDEFRIRSVFNALNLLILFLDIYESHHAAYLLFLPFRNYLDSFEVSKYPPVFSEVLKNIDERLNKLASQELEKITMGIKKPKLLRLYEPVIEPVYDTKKKKCATAEQAEKDKLLHKFKREKKGALREIRRDRAFISKIKFKQQQKSDAERIRKVKEIYSWGAQQQGEINAFKRTKNKKR